MLLIDASSNSTRANGIIGRKTIIAMDQLALGFQITSLFTYHLAISATKTCMESFPYSSMMVKLTCLTCQRVSMLECSLVEKQSIKQLSLSIQWIRPSTRLYFGQTDRRLCKAGNSLHQFGDLRILRTCLALIASTVDK